MATMNVSKILFLADTHIGFDLPLRPKINRRRRGYDFLKNFEKALEPALNGDIDCIIHGGDLFYRSQVPIEIADLAFNIIKKIADKRIPFYIVPGNHEGSIIPHAEYLDHKYIKIFDKPRTYFLDTSIGKMALAGFPFIRHNIRGHFRKILSQTNWDKEKSDFKLLCMHQTVEGATVGVQNYTFSYKKNVIRTIDIPDGLTAVLSGHIHRAQILNRSLSGSPISAPVLYPGSIERTSFAERLERKGYLTLELETGRQGKTEINKWQFHDLKARPMYRKDLNVDGIPQDLLKNKLVRYLRSIPANSIVDFRIMDIVPEGSMEVLSAPALRQLAPSTMNVTASFI